MYFCEKINSINQIFKFHVPDYETIVFGGKIGELRLVKKEIDFNKTEIFPLNNLRDYLISNKIIACTFRGKEDIHIVQTLIKFGFDFIATYNSIEVDEKSYKRIKISTKLEVCKAEENEFDEILTLESNVFDFSTFQIDNRFENSITSYRNALRVKSYFDKPGHYASIIKYLGKIVGFLQFKVDFENKVADCVNGAIHQDFQGLFIGPKLYSESFSSIFKLGVDKITGGYCTQNYPVAKIFKACNFRITDQEIHLRIKI
uniref:hypothetical protein n=1 Tax=Algoriphagus sp. TaxID=1872435 RepID=UPI00404831AF